MYAGTVLVDDGWPGIREASENESISGWINRLASSSYIMTLELCCNNWGCNGSRHYVKRGDEGDTPVKESVWDNGIYGWEDCSGTGEGEREREKMVNYYL